VLDPATASPNADLLYDIKGARAFHQREVFDPDQVGVRALDEVTLVVELEGPTSYFPHLLVSHPSYPVPRHVVEAHGAAWTEVGNIVTNGPFRLESWQPDESLVLIRNPEYHGRFTGNVERVELCLLPEWSARLALYEADRLDVLSLYRLPPPEMERVRQRHPGEYVLVPEMATFYVAFDVGRPPFDDVRVRRAFVLATDRERLADVVLRGYGSPATGGFVPPGMPGRSAGIGLPYDPGQARQLLAEAGYSGGHGFPVVKALVPEAKVPQSKYLRAQWRESLGVDIPWESMEWSRFRDRMDREPPHLFLVAWGADYPDPNNFLRESSFWDHTRWQNKVYNILVEKARRLTDQGKRMELYQEADRILVEEAPIMPLIYSRQGLLVKPWVRKYPTSPIVIEYFFGKDVIIEPH
jgi:ABC-type oligopeptide transport system substrate-binding subunit